MFHCVLIKGFHCISISSETLNDYLIDYVMITSTTVTSTPERKKRGAEYFMNCNLASLEMKACQLQQNCVCVCVSVHVCVCVYACVCGGGGGGGGWGGCVCVCVCVYLLLAAGLRNTITFLGLVGLPSLSTEATLSSP